jgi:hypothetical protein
MGPLDQGMSQMTDRDSAGSARPAVGGAHGRDLRFAGGLSAGLVSTILVGGALLAPLSNFGGDKPSAADHSRELTLKLPAAPRADAPQRPGSGSGSDSESGAVPTLLSPAAGALTAAPATLAGGSAPATPGGTQGGGIETSGGGGSRNDAGSTIGSGAGIALVATDRLGDDANEDGIPDQRWQAYGLDKLVDPNGDIDGDGILNRDELEIRTAPTTQHSNAGVSDGDLDFDRDGLRNGLEAKAGAKPYLADSNGDGVTDANDDADGDGLTNKTEQSAGTALDNQDSNGDGVSDSQADSDGDGLTNPTE